jgi:uncharacterized protein
MSAEVANGIVDLMVQLHPPGQVSIPVPRELLRDEASLASWPSPGIVDYLFDGAGERARLAAEPALVVAEFENWGIAGGLLTIPAEEFDETVDFLGSHIDRFWIAVRVNPHRGMESVRALQRARERCDRVKACAVTPLGTYPQIPLDAKEYYPIYAKCVELDLPLCTPVGIPGPLVPGRCQDPMALDEVCWFFPELKVVLKHGGQPWADVCAHLVRKWPNLYYSTSAYAPRRYPSEIVALLRGRFAHKVMFAGYWPLLSYERIFREIDDLGLSEEARGAFLSANARRVFAL